MGNIVKGETIKGFMRTLADNNRLGILQGVCEKFAVLMGAAKGELEMVVQSASVSRTLELYGGVKIIMRGMSIAYSTILTSIDVQKLDTKTLQRLETAVAKSEYSQGKKLKVVTKVGDPENPVHS